MKKNRFLILVILMSACFAMPAQAQINVSIQPTWGPVGYNYVNNYYIPDIEAYYNVPTAQFTYMDGGRWVTTAYLPPRYASFDLYHCYKAVVNEPNPWYHHDQWRGKYYGYRGRYDQGLIRESSDRRYFAGRREGGYGEYRRGEVHRSNEIRREEEHRGEVHREEVHHEEVRHEEARHDEARGGMAGRGDFHNNQVNHGAVNRTAQHPAVAAHPAAASHPAVTHPVADKKR